MNDYNNLLDENNKLKLENENLKNNAPTSDIDNKKVPEEKSDKKGSFTFNMSEKNVSARNLGVIPPLPFVILSRISSHILFKNG